MGEGLKEVHCRQSTTGTTQVLQGSERKGATTLQINIDKFHRKPTSGANFRRTNANDILCYEKLLTEKLQRLWCAVLQASACRWRGQQKRQGAPTGVGEREGSSMGTADKLAYRRACDALFGPILE